MPFIRSGDLYAGAVAARSIGVPVRNSTGATVPAGSLIAINGVDSDGFFLFSLAQAGTGARASHILNTTTPDGGAAFATKGGLFPFDTSAWAIGTALYLSSSFPGSVTSNPPAADQQIVGYVRKQATDGLVEFMIDGIGKIGGESIGGLPEGYPVKVDVTLDDAAIRALRASPFALAPAPGPGKAFELIGGTLIANNVAGYTIGDPGDDLAIKLGDGAGPQLSAVIDSGGILDATGLAGRNILPNNAPPTLTSATAVNQAVVLHNVGIGEFTGGDVGNVLKVSMLLRVTAAWS